MSSKSNEQTIKDALDKKEEIYVAHVDSGTRMIAKRYSWGYSNYPDKQRFDKVYCIWQDDSGECSDDFYIDLLEVTEA